MTGPIDESGHRAAWRTDRPGWWIELEQKTQLGLDEEPTEEELERAVAKLREEALMSGDDVPDSLENQIREAEQANEARRQREAAEQAANEAKKPK